MVHTSGRAGPATQHDAQAPLGRRRRNGGVLARSGGFVLPAYAAYVLFLIVPLLLTVVLSFTDWDGFSFSTITSSFNGVDNYQELAHDRVFWQALVHNVWFLLGSMVLKTLLALALALALYRRFALSGLFRSIFLVPSVLSLVVVGLVFQFLLDPNNGVINPLLRAIGLGRFAGAWFGDPDRALPVLVLIDVWVAFGIYMFIFLSSLTQLPTDVSESARIDGASAWQETVYVTVPMLAASIRMVLLLAAIDSLKVFATVYVTTGGGPNHATEVLATWAFFQGFDNNRVGYGNAILSVLLVVTFLLAYFYARRLRTPNPTGGVR